MELKDFLEKNSISQNEFSKQNKVKQAVLSNIVHHKSNPSLLNAKKIVDATKGKVSFNDLIVCKKD